MGEVPEDILVEEGGRSSHIPGSSGEAVLVWGKKARHLGRRSDGMWESAVHRKSRQHHSMPSDFLQCRWLGSIIITTSSKGESAAAVEVPGSYYEPRLNKYQAQAQAWRGQQLKLQMLKSSPT